MSRWEKQDGATQHYCEVSLSEVLVGRHSGSPHSDSAGACSRSAFLQGQLQDPVLRGLGEEILWEVLIAAGGSQADQKAFLQPTAHPCVIG